MKNQKYMLNGKVNMCRYGDMYTAQLNKLFVDNVLLLLDTKRLVAYSSDESEDYQRPAMFNTPSSDEDGWNKFQTEEANETKRGNHLIDSDYIDT